MRTAFLPLFPDTTSTPHRQKKTPVQLLYALNPRVLPCRHFPARRLPVFVPEEGAPRWLPPTPSSYCSGLLEWGRIRHSLTIALLNANHATEGHWKERETRFWQIGGAVRGGKRATGLRREKPTAECAGCSGGGGQSCRRGPTDA